MFSDESTLVSIGSNSFASCINLSFITIPSGVTNIGSGAFYGCYRLVEVYNLSQLSLSISSSNYGYITYYAINIYKNAFLEKVILF